jgi:elongation factor 1-gamma
MSDLRIFSYLPNPRIWKATIAARLCGVEVEIRGAHPRELAGWLWDFDARPLVEGEGDAGENAREAHTGFRGRLFKTDAFLDAHPFGTVPAAFSPDGSVGIFESNSIMRAVARLGEKRFPLYGSDPYSAARIDSFLDASLVFARDSQVYLLALGSDALSPEVHARTAEAFGAWMGGIERALAPDREFLVGDEVSLADICFAAELTLFSNERARGSWLAERGLGVIVADDLSSLYPRATAHYEMLCKHPAFTPDLEPYLEKLRARVERDRTEVA